MMRSSRLLRSSVVLQLRPPPLRLLGQKSPKSKGATPVSYTNLRAHETVLETVCRLLLEKKKKKNFFTTHTSAYNYMGELVSPYLETNVFTT